MAEHAFCFVPFGVVEYDKQQGIFGVQFFQELEELMGVESVAEHVVVLVVSLCSVAVEVCPDVCELLYWFAAFRKPASRNFWLDAESCLIQDE